MPHVRRLLAASLLALPVAAGCMAERASEFPPEPARAWARALRDTTFERTPARRERGRYLANTIVLCVMCHSERDRSQPGAPPVAGREFAGAVLRDDSTSLIVAPNLTPDRRTGAGRWSDDMLARAIREGVGHDGRALHPQMWSSSFRVLSDEDVASIVVYLRSLPAVSNALPATRVSEERRRSIEASLQPLVGPVSGPDPRDPVALGRHLVSAANCAGCHTSWYSPRDPGILAGGNLIDLGSGPETAFSTNITPHADAIGTWDAATFRAMVRSGKGGTMSGLMPWIALAGLTDTDLDAIHAFLMQMPAVAHRIDNLSPPTACAVCGQSHGAGERNVLELPAGITLPTEALARLTGTYRTVTPPLTWVVTLERGRLIARETDGPQAVLIPLTATRFHADGWLAPVEFRGDSAGHATQLVSREIEDLVGHRVH